MLELAYIDAGSGSLIIQGAIASVAALIFFFRTQLARLIPGRRNRAQEAEASTSGTPAASADDVARRR
jgi:hypothetical protein